MNLKEVEEGIQELFDLNQQQSKLEHPGSFKSSELEEVYFD